MTAASRWEPRRGCTHSPPLPPSRLPDATRTSTDPPSPARRNKTWIAAQIVITAVVVWYVGKALVEQWAKFRGTPIEVHPRWGTIIISSVIALTAHTTLIETWRRMILAWGDRLS